MPGPLFVFLAEPNGHWTFWGCPYFETHNYWNTKEDRYHCELGPVSLILGGCQESMGNSWIVCCGL